MENGFITSKCSFLFRACLLYLMGINNTADARNLYLALCVFGRAKLLESVMWNFVWS